MKDIFELVNNMRFCANDDCDHCTFEHRDKTDCAEMLLNDAAETMEVFEDGQPHVKVLNVIDSQEDVARLNEKIDHPVHYSGDIECIDYIESLGILRGFCIGSAIKYIHRAGSKPGENEVDDLKKAVWYLNRLIDSLKQME